MGDLTIIILLLSVRANQMDGTLRDSTVRAAQCVTTVTLTVTRWRFNTHTMGTLPSYPVLYLVYCQYTVLYLNVLYCTVLYSTVYQCTVLYLSVLYCTLLDFIPLYCTVFKCTVLYYTY